MSVPNGNGTSNLNRSSSNPDLSPSLNNNRSMTSSIVNVSNQSEEETAFVVKVFRSDQTFKYFPVHKVKLNGERKNESDFLMLFCSGNDVETISDAGDHRIRYYRAEQVCWNDV